MKAIHTLAFDLGGSGGKVLSGLFDGSTLTVHEAGRFPNDAVQLGEQFCWDMPRLIYHVKQELMKANRSQPVTSFAFDTWGTCVGYLDTRGNMLAVPRSYRDQQFSGIANKIYTETMPRLELYKRFGTLVTEDLGLFQTYGYKVMNPDVFAAIGAIMHAPDYIRYFLTGEAYAEETTTSTGGFLDEMTRRPVKDVFDALGIPVSLLPDIVPPATKLSGLSPMVRDELGMDAAAIAVAGHDTASALLPLSLGERDCFISCGTWSLLGVLSEQTYTTEFSLRNNFSNELSPQGKIRLDRNISGMWLYAECLRKWGEADHDVIAQQVQEAKAFRSFIDVEDPVFGPYGDMPARIAAFCRQTGQPVPETHGQFIRCILESLALKHRKTLDDLFDITGRTFDRIQIVGGGSRNEQFMHMVADACGLPVLLGPSESSSLGNVIAQLVALGEVASFEQGAQLARQTYTERVIQPNNKDMWDEAFARYQKAIRTV